MRQNILLLASVATFPTVGAGGGSVFQLGTQLDSVNTLVSLVILIVFTVCFETFLESLEDYFESLEEEGVLFLQIINKVCRELMIMGFISFFLFIMISVLFGLFSSRVLRRWTTALHESLPAMIAELRAALGGDPDFQVSADSGSLMNSMGILCARLCPGLLRDSLLDFKHKGLIWRARLQLVKGYFAHRNGLPFKFEFSGYLGVAVRHYSCDILDIKPSSWLFLALALGIGALSAGHSQPLSSEQLSSNTTEHSGGTRQLAESTGAKSIQSIPTSRLVLWLTGVLPSLVLLLLFISFNNLIHMSVVRLCSLAGVGDSDDQLSLAEALHKLAKEEMAVGEGNSDRARQKVHRKMESMKAEKNRMRTTEPGSQQMKERPKTICGPKLFADPSLKQSKSRRIVGTPDSGMTTGSANSSKVRPYEPDVEDWSFANVAPKRKAKSLRNSKTFMQGRRFSSFEPLDTDQATDVLEFGSGVVPTRESVDLTRLLHKYRVMHTEELLKKSFNSPKHTSRATSGSPPPNITTRRVSLFGVLSQGINITPLRGTAPILDKLSLERHSLENVQLPPLSSTECAQEQKTESPIKTNSESQQESSMVTKKCGVAFDTSPKSIRKKLVGADADAKPRLAGSHACLRRSLSHSVIKAQTFKLKRLNEERFVFPFGGRKVTGAALDLLRVFNAFHLSIVLCSFAHVWAQEDNGYIIALLTLAPLFINITILGPWMNMKFIVVESVIFSQPGHIGEVLEDMHEARSVVKEVGAMLRSRMQRRHLLSDKELRQALNQDKTSAEVAILGGGTKSLVLRNAVAELWGEMVVAIEHKHAITWHLHGFGHKHGEQEEASADTERMRVHLSRRNFRKGLARLDVFLSRRKFRILFQVLDHDLSGLVDLDEFCLLIFPNVDKEDISPKYINPLG